MLALGGFRDMTLVQSHLMRYLTFTAIEAVLLGGGIVTLLVRSRAGPDRRGVKLALASLGAVSAMLGAVGFFGALLQVGVIGYLVLAIGGFGLAITLPFRHALGKWRPKLSRLQFQLVFVLVAYLFALMWFGGLYEAVYFDDARAFSFNSEVASSQTERYLRDAAESLRLQGEQNDALTPFLKRFAGGDPPDFACGPSWPSCSYRVGNSVFDFSGCQEITRTSL